MAVNRLSLKVSVVFDKAQLKKETKLAQQQLDKAFSNNIKRQEKLQDKLITKTKTSNKQIKKQTTLFGQMTGALKKTTLQLAKFFIIAQAFKLLFGLFRDAISLALQLDTAFTNFSIVSKATAGELANVNTQIDGLTLGLGKLKKEVIDTVTEFSRAGFSISESLLLAENAIKGANVGATELSNITTFLIAGLKAFNLEAEESGRILDVLFRVANTTAINLEGIGEAFLRSANTLSTAGASIEESASLIAGANESIQDPAKVGTALKTIASRLRGVSENGKVIPKLAESFNAVGVSIQEADGSFRNIFDVFQDLARILPTLDDLTRESLLEKLAGKRQKNIVIGLLNNFDTVEQALKDALNSTGEVATANEKFLESLQGRTNQLKEAWNQLLTTFTDTDGLKDIITGFKNLVVFITEFVQKTPKAIFLIGGLALAFSPFGAVVAILGGIVSAIAGIGLISSVTRTKVERLTQSFAEYNQQITDLNTRIGNLEATNNRTDAEEKLLKVYREQLDAVQRLADIEQGKLVKARLGESEATISRITRITDDLRAILEEFPEEAVKASENTLDGIRDYEAELLKVQVQAQETLNSVSEGSQAFVDATTEYNIATEALKGVIEVQKLLGIFVPKSTSAMDSQNQAIAEQITLFKEVQKLVNSTSEDYQVLSDALEELEVNGFLTDDMLNTLIETYPDVISQTGLAKDAFIDYVNSNKTKTIEEINRLKALANAEIETAKIIINSRKAIDFLSEGQGESSIFAQAELAIKNAENGIILLENEEKQIKAIDKARKDAITSSKKEVKVLTEMELALNNINFQIDLQQKLLERANDEDQVGINENLIELYEDLRVALIEQQKELEAQGKSLKKGTKEYDDYIDASFKLSLAIEDATNGIVKFTDANKELNKVVEENKLDAIAESLKELGEEINDEIQKQIDLQKNLAKESEAYYDNLISSKEDEITALKEANDEREKQVKLEELLQSLQDLRERRANILANKSARIVKDAEVGFEFISDPREIKQVNEDILDAEKSIDEFRREQKFEQDIKRLETTIDTLEKEAEAEQAGFDKRIEELGIFQDTINTEIENGGLIQETTLQTIQDALLGIETTSYGVRLTEVDGFITDYNTRIAKLNAQKATVDAINSSINATGNNIQRAIDNANAINSGSSSSNTSTTASTESGSNASNRISGGNVSNSNSETSINNLNVNSNANSIEEIIEDAKGFAARVISDR